MALVNGPHKSCRICAVSFLFLRCGNISCESQCWLSNIICRPS